MTSEEPQIDIQNDRYPFCIVWTPIPLLTWLLPIVGHMGICTSDGIIRDFAGPYYVSKDNMGFGRPTRYILLDQKKVHGGSTKWDDAVNKSSEVYMTRMHNLFWDNCHSHVGLALTLMSYNDSSHWNMVRLAFWMFFWGKYVSIGGFLKTWLPFLVIAITIAVLLVYFK